MLASDELEDELLNDVIKEYLEIAQKAKKCSALITVREYHEVPKSIDDLNKEIRKYQDFHDCYIHERIKTIDDMYQLREKLFPLWGLSIPNTSILKEDSFGDNSNPFFSSMESEKRTELEALQSPNFPILESGKSFNFEYSDKDHEIENLRDQLKVISSRLEKYEVENSSLSKENALLMSEIEKMGEQLISANKRLEEQDKSFRSRIEALEKSLSDQLSLQAQQVDKEVRSNIQLNIMRDSSVQHTIEDISSVKDEEAESNRVVVKHQLDKKEDEENSSFTDLFSETPRTNLVNNSIQDYLKDYQTSESDSSLSDYSNYSSKNEDLDLEEDSSQKDFLHQFNSKIDELLGKKV